MVPDTRFDDTLTLEVGGKTFEMTYLGEGHGSDLIATVVRPENVVFIVDAAAPKRLPFRDFGGADIDAWMQQIETAKGLEFDIFAPGHGPVGTKADLIDAQTYMTELRAAVLEGLKAGKTPDELVETIKMEDYSDWQAYDDWLALNIQGMARFLQDSGQVN